MKFLVSTLGVLVGALLATPCFASFGFTASLADPSEISQVISPSSMSNVQFTNGSGDTLECDMGGTVLHLVKGTGNAGSNDPDPFNSPFSVYINITDYEIATPANFKFDGVMLGTYSNRRSKITTSYAVGTKSITIGGKTYTVTMLPFVAPGPPVVFEKAEVLAFVTCDPTGTSVSNVTLTTNNAKVGRAVNGSVTLNGPAPYGGAVVTLTSSAPALTLPATITIPQGQTSGTFTGNAAVAANPISVSAAWNGTSASSNLSISSSLCGDINGNGAIDFSDAVHFIRTYAGLDPAPNC